MLSEKELRKIIACCAAPVFDVGDPIEAKIHVKFQDFVEGKTSIENLTELMSKYETRCGAIRILGFPWCSDSLKSLFEVAEESIIWRLHVHFPDFVADHDFDALRKDPGARRAEQALLAAIRDIIGVHLF